MAFTEIEVEVLPGGWVDTLNAAKVMSCEPRTIHQRCWSGNWPVRTTKAGRKRLHNLQDILDHRDGKAASPAAA